MVLVSGSTNQNPKVCVPSPIVGFFSLWMKDLNLYERFLFWWIITLIFSHFLGNHHLLLYPPPLHMWPSSFIIFSLTLPPPLSDDVMGEQPLFHLIFFNNALFQLQLQFNSFHIIGWWMGRLKINNSSSQLKLHLRSKFDNVEKCVGA